MVYLFLFKDFAVQLVIKMLRLAQINSAYFGRPVLPLDVDLHLVYYLCNFDFVLQSESKSNNSITQFRLNVGIECVPLDVFIAMWVAFL